MVIKLRWNINPVHCKVMVFMGVDKDHYQNCGLLTFDREQAEAFRYPFFVGGHGPEPIEEGWEK